MSGWMRIGPSSASGAPILITGGAGFVGCNIADRLAAEGQRVRIFDDLSRPGVEHNLTWLKSRHGESIAAVIGDVRDRRALRDAVDGVSAVIHLAAQVAVTTSVIDPRADFEINAQGTFNVLEAVRDCREPPPLVFASTNKVYGNLNGLRIIERGRRYEPADDSVYRNGIGEEQPLDFHSPYGCSKGAADQYVLDYARIYNLPTAVLRLSCMYGPRQLGSEDQGWVAHFLKSAVERKPITVYGDGKQVRDVLFIEDAVDAFLATLHHMPWVRGQAFNIGGGSLHTLSLLELLDLIGGLTDTELSVSYAPWRPGDQLYYVSDIRKFQTLVGWQPATSVATGVGQLHAWLLTLTQAGSAPTFTPSRGLSAEQRGCEAAREDVGRSSEHRNANSREAMQ